MKIFNSTTRIESTLVLNTIVKVNQLSSFDMIYVYHLLSIGTKVNLIKTSTTLKGNLIYDVYYRTFKLGNISIEGISKEFLVDFDKIEAEILNLSKEKYLPLKSLELNINSNKSLKMVG
jgi:hypothetical protein